MNNIYKHFFSVFILFFISFVFFILLSSIFMERVYINSSLKSLRDFTKKTIEHLKSLENIGNYSFLKTLSEVNSIRITVISNSGDILFDSHIDSMRMENHLDREEVQESLKRGEGSNIRYSNTLNSKMLYFAKKFVINEKIYIFRVSKEVSDLKHYIRPYKNKFLVFLSFLFFLIFISAFLYIRSYARKIEYLQSALREIELGSFDVSINFNKNDIFYSIAECIKKHGQSIKELTEDIKNQKELLSNILENLPFPILIADKNQEILVANKYFREFFPNVNKLDELVNLIRDENLYKYIRNIEYGESNFNIEISFKEQYFSIFCNKINNKNNEIILLSFIDITEIKKTEKMKTDFTANVSHELKTPITVLKGYIETLEDEIEESKKPIIRVLKKHIDRISNLVSDVLLLSRLDAKVPLEEETFSIRELMINAIEPFNSEIALKKIKLQMEIEEQLTYYGDSFLILQALINLISNAIKYTPEGGNIEIKARKKEENIIIEIADTGVGIPKEYQEKIFQRFFVLNKSRSRQLGGTGLGLSIVKHIIELHKGNITVESEPGKGAKFIITL